MIVLVSILINVESQGQFAIPLQPSTFVVTLQALRRIAFCEFRCSALCFLFNALAIAGDKDLMLTWFVLLAGEGRMAFVLACMSAALVFTARLLASLRRVFAIARFVTGLSTLVEATL